MAVFPTGAQALRAAFQMQRSMANLETYGSIDPQRFLRVGIHSGPCLAVTLNDRMDYFGTAVNVASRVEHEAAGGEIVLTRDAFDEPGVSDVLDAECDASDECDVQLRGLSGATRIVRIPASADIIQPTWR
jgi:class 3 adenylate cyclase